MINDSLMRNCVFFAPPTLLLSTRLCAYYSPGGTFHDKKKKTKTNDFVRDMPHTTNVYAKVPV